jgi:hypothetical protein
LNLFRIETTCPTPHDWCHDCTVPERRTELEMDAAHLAQALVGRLSLAEAKRRAAENPHLSVDFLPSGHA